MNTGDIQAAIQHRATDIRGWSCQTSIDVNSSLGTFCTRLVASK